MRFPWFSSHGVLGMNARNLLYVKPFNPRKAVAFADDKMKTKAFLSARGIPTAKLFARIDNRRQLRNFDFSTLPDECVLKPNYGFGGEGIIILKGRKNGEFLDQGKTPISDQELREHIEDVLDGKFSVNGRNDTAFFEQILVSDDAFVPFKPAGLPDIRIIVFNLVPVMAMLRIPTAESRGKANIHLGGVGIGIDIAKGITTHAAQYSKMVTELQHGQPVEGLQIPYWDEMLFIASKIQYITNIGYLAVDLTIDRELGPVLLEVNARAGLTVQIANLAPLAARLKRVEGLKVTTPEKGVRLAKDLFGGARHREVQHEQPQKPILGPIESIEINGDGFTFEEACRISPERAETIFDQTLVAELLSKKALEPVEKSRDTYKVKFSLARKKIQTLIKSGSVQPYRIVIGQRDLAGFLIDPSKKRIVTMTPAGLKKDMRPVDDFLCQVDEELALLKYLKPVNLLEEVDRLRADDSYNPTFLYRPLPSEIDATYEAVSKTETDDTPLGVLLRKKRREILLKIDLLRARGDSVRFTSGSLALYGAPSPALISFAQEHLSSTRKKPADIVPEEPLSALKTKERFESVLKHYGLHEWQVVMKSQMVADCAVGEHKVFIREGAVFTPMHLNSLIAHEIETHAITAENGDAQPFRLFRRGFANYLDTQEGLAIYNQTRVLPVWHEKNRLHAKSIIGLAYALEHSFAETREYLQKELGYSQDKALRKAIDFKRGLTMSKDPGGFTKAITYFRGYRAIKHFTEGGGDLQKLYTGKIAIEDLSLIERMEGLRPPVVLPDFLRTPKPPRKPRQTRKRS